MKFRNVEMSPLKNPSNFRKLSMGNWGAVGDPQVYAVLELDCTKALLYIKKLKKQNKDARITVNHLIGRIVALTWRKYPQLNGVIANKKIYLRKDVDIFFQVGLEGAETELVGICIRQADQKGITQFAQKVVEKSNRIRKSDKEDARKAQKSFRFLPWRLIPFAVRVLDWLQFDRNINLAWMGIPRDMMGSVMITSVGTLGMEFVFVPLTLIGRTPAQIAIGSVHKKPVVVDEEIVVGSRLNLCCTFDHRFIDGILASKMAKMMTKLFENIDEYEDLIEGKVGLESFS